MNTWNPVLDYLMEIITLKWVIIFAMVYFLIIWISIIFWVFRDITNRTDRIFLQFLSIFVVIIFGPFWIFLYLLLRPSSTLFDQFYKEVEENLAYLNEEINRKLELIEKQWKK